MEEIGKVKSVDGITARVVIQKTSACEHCIKGKCDMEAEGFETEAINAAGAQVGQTVKVVMKAQTYIKGAFVLYILPIVALIGGAIAGRLYLGSYLPGLSPDTLSVIGGFSGLLLSFILVKLIASKLERKTEYKSVIEEIIN